MAASDGRRRYRRRLVPIVMAAALAAGWMSASTALAAETARTGLYGGKSDCGAPDNQGYTRDGRVTWVRDGNTLTITYRVRNLLAFGIYRVALFDNDTACQFVGWFNDGSPIQMDDRGKAMGSLIFPASVAGYSTFYLDFQHLSLPSYAETTTVTLP